MPKVTTYFFDEKGVVLGKTVSDGPTKFPEKLAKANEILKKATLLPPFNKK